MQQRAVAMINLKLITLTFTAYLITGCSGAEFKYLAIDGTTGKFPTNYTISEYDIKVFSPIGDWGNKRFTILLTSTNRKFKYDNQRNEFFSNYFDFEKKTIDHMGFQNPIQGVQIKEYLESFDLPNSDIHVSGKTSIAELEKHTDEFLVISQQLTWRSHYKTNMVISIYDPKQKNIVFLADYNGTRAAGYARGTIYPVYNAINSWIKESKLASGTI